MNISEFSSYCCFEPSVSDVCLVGCEVDFIKNMMLLSKFENYEITDEGVPCTYMSDVMDYMKEKNVGKIDNVCYVDNQGNIRPVSKNCMNISVDENGDSMVCIKNLN